MAKSNRQRIEEALDLVTAGFGLFVDDQLRQRYGDGWMQEVVSKGNWGTAKGGSAGSLDDPDFVLWAATFEWQSVFRKVLGQTERSLISELREARHKWAHKEGFTVDATYRLFDSAYLLLSAVSAPEAAAVDEQRQEVLRLRFEEQTKKAAQTGLAPVAGDAVAGLRPWRHVMEPHEDVATGEYQLAEFAANLGQVHRGQGRPEYADPSEFFRRTYMTRGLSVMLKHTLKRMTGQGGEPVVDLQTQFGGGKTHSMLAVYHACSGTPISDLMGMAEIANEVGIADLPRGINRAVLVGNSIQPGKITKKPDGTEVRTLWGELGWQLGGKAGYEYVRDSDEYRTNPGDALRELFEAYAPCVILIDEWIAYARQLWNREDLPGGTFDTHMTFAQALTDAAKEVANSMLIVSVPASDEVRDVEGAEAGIEVGGVAGLEALKRLRQVIHRADSPWQPASAEEGFEIVRRRLFKDPDPNVLAERDKTCRVLAEMYRHSADFPSDSRDHEYEKRLRACYPIHPELFDRLYRDWATLERFQRTRGVLRLMATVVQALWNRDDQSPIILPASIPLDDSDVFEEITHYLEDNWKPVVDADIDGPGSMPVSLDKEITGLGKVQASRRVARTVFLGSAPTLHRRSEDGQAVENPNRGIEDARVRLGCSLPGDTVAVFGDALRRLSDRSTHLFATGSRYWYSTTPSVARIAQDKADGYDEDEIVDDLVRWVREESDRGDFARVHRCPDSSSEIDDEATAALVVLRPDATHTRGREDSPAVQAASEMVRQRGTHARTYQNMLVFLAAESNRLGDLLSAVRQHKAWSEIDRDKKAMNLDTFAIEQTTGKLAAAADTIRHRINETYVWMLVPSQDKTGPVRIDPVKINGQGTLAGRTSKKASADNSLITAFGPALLRMELDRVPLWRGDHVPVKKAWEDFASYVYLPRLRDQQVFLRAVASGPQAIDLAHDGFGYAESFDEGEGRYRGLVLHATAAAPVADGSSVLVKPDVAVSQRHAELEAKTAAEKESTYDGATAAHGSKTVSPGSSELTSGSSRVGAAKPTRFYGRTTVDASRMGRDTGEIATEIVAHLLALGANVNVTVEIEADHGGGFDKDILRIVSENSKSLGFEAREFE